MYVFIQPETEFNLKHWQYKSLCKWIIASGSFETINMGNQVALWLKPSWNKIFFSVFQST